MSAAVPWNRNEVLHQLRSEVWRHVSPAATAHDVELDAAALLGLDHADVARLADLHFVLHPTQAALLERSAAMLRRLKSTTTPTTEISHDRVRGSVDWTATTRARAHTRTAVVVTQPQLRDGDVQPNRMLALLLTELRDRSRMTGLRSLSGDSANLAARVAEVGRSAAAFAANRALVDVTPSAPTPRELVSADSPRWRRRHPGLVEAYRSYEELVTRRSPSAVRDAVERYGFAVASDGALFELLVLFGLRDALLALAFEVEPLGLFDGGLRFTARRGQDRVIAWHQRLPRSWRALSRYPQALRAHGVADPHDLRPDLVLHVALADGTERWTVVEAKTTTSGRPVSVLFRRALTDLLAYRSSFAAILDSQARWGLGVVWGRGLRGADHDVQVCTPDHLHDAVAGFVGPRPDCR